MSAFEASAAESVDPTGFWRFLFWLTYAIGNMTLAFSWLLAQVPRPDHHADMRLDYAVRASVAGLMLICILMGRWLWKIRNPVEKGNPAVGIRLVLCTAWIEGAIGLIGILGIAISRH